jgi:thiol-disulfide isomerase/thioredoxin
LCECSKNDPTMFFALLVAAGLLAIWMFYRGSKMKKNNVLILIAVVVVVAGVAWFRSVREEAPTATPAPTASPVAAGDVNATTAPVRKGELCPEPPPTTQVGPAAASGPGSSSPDPAVAKKLPRVVDLGADKCKACKELAPILEQLRKEYEGRVIVEFIDVWKNPKAGEPYKISAIPTQVFFDADGKEVWRHLGFLPKADFVAKFAELGVK